MRLYYAPQTRSMRARWILEEIGAPYELVRVDLSAGEQRRPEYLEVNPCGRVPALVDGGVTLFESAAICQYLADKFPEHRLAPPVGTAARDLYYQWIHFAMSGLEPPALAIILHTMSKPEAERIPVVADEGRLQLSAALAVVDGALGGRTFMLGDEFTAADVMIGSTLMWAKLVGEIGAELRATTAYLARLALRPACQRSVAD